MLRSSLPTGILLGSIRGSWVASVAELTRRARFHLTHPWPTQIGAPEVRAFLGGRRPADRCLYVSTGGFTKEARYEADRANVPLFLVDMPQLRTLLLDNYEQLDTETRRLVPLTKLYWPIDQGG